MLKLFSAQQRKKKSVFKNQQQNELDSAIGLRCFPVCSIEIIRSTFYLVCEIIRFGIVLSRLFFLSEQNRIRKAAYCHLLQKFVRPNYRLFLVILTTFAQTIAADCIKFEQSSAIEYITCIINSSSTMFEER